MSLAFALGGGGSKGDFEIGAVRYLNERGYEPNILCGTSVGSINAIKLAEGLGGTQGLISIWLDRLQTSSDMFLEEEWLKDILDLALLKYGEQYSPLDASQKRAKFAHDFIIRQVFPPQVIIDLVTLGLDIAAIIRALDKIGTTQSAYNLTPIRAMLDDTAVLDLGKIAASGIKLRLLIVGLASGKLRYVDENGGLFERDGTLVSDGVDLRDAVMASASEPVIFPPVMISGEACVDGGVREVVPFQAAIQAGATRVFVIAASERLLPEADAAKTYENASIIEIGVRSILGATFDEITETDLTPAINWPGIACFIRPTIQTHDAMVIDPGLVKIWMDYGYMVAADASAVFTNDGRLRGRQLADEITNLRQEILKVEIDANGQIAPGEMAATPEALDLVRSMKWQLFDLVSERVRLGGAVPAEAATWWKEWERHPWDFITDTPWMSYAFLTDDRPAADPPGEVPWLVVPLNLSFLNPLLLSDDNEMPPLGLSAAVSAALF